MNEYLTKLETNQVLSSNITYMDKSKVANPKLSYLIPVFNALQDISTRAWSLNNIFDVLVIPKELEVFLFSFQVFGRIDDIPDGVNTTEFKLIYQDKSVVATCEPLTGELVRGFVKFSAHFRLVKFQKPGKYHFEVTHNGVNLKGTDKFYFTVIKQNG